MRLAGPNLVIGSMLFLVVFGISAATLFGLAKLVQTDQPIAAADDGGGDASVEAPSETGILDLVGKDQQFDRRTLTVSAGAEVTIVFDNQDAGILHNVAVYTDSDVGELIFRGELFTGPDMREEKFTAPSAPGSYFFRCDVHPDTMTGTFTVR